MNNQASKKIYDELNTFADLEKLIEDGEAENLYLECKSPRMPKISQDLKVMFAKTLSGFSNTEGGILLLGVATQKKEAHGNIDVLSQLEPLGRASSFGKEINNRIPTLTSPSITSTEFKVIKAKPTDTAGIIVLYVPKTSLPVQSLLDEKFYFRTGDEFKAAPWELIRRLFAATDSPDIAPNISNKGVAFDEAGSTFAIPMKLINRSNAIGEHVEYVITILKPKDFESITCKGAADISSHNPGKTIFNGAFKKVLHRHLSTAIEPVVVKPKPSVKTISIGIEIFANKMAARRFEIEIKLDKKESKLTKLDGPIYL